MPTREQIAEALEYSFEEIGAVGARNIADFVRGFFAAPQQAPAEADNTPPDPLPMVLPAGQRWRSDDGKGVGVFTEPAELQNGWYSGRYKCSWISNNPRGLIHAGHIDWAHWRSMQSKDPGSPSGQVGGNPASQASPDGDASLSNSPLAPSQAERASLRAEIARVQGYAEGAGGGLKLRVDGQEASIKEIFGRLFDLELQGRVTRRRQTGDYPAEWVREDGSPDVILARSEQEERNR